MSGPRDHTPFVESVFHPSDFSEGSERAFAHALAIALREKTSLTVLNAGVGDKRKRWSNFPSVRATLERWGILQSGGSRTSVFRELDVRVKKVSLEKRRPLSAVLEYLDDNPTDLIVVSTAGRDGLPRWLKPSVAEGIARGSDIMTLFVPGSARGFVSLEDGRIDIKRILVSADQQSDSRFALNAAGLLAGLSESRPVDVMTLNQTSGLPEFPACEWRSLNEKDDSADSIVEAANRESADLIVMSTEEPEGILGALRGSRSEQVVRRAPCAVLAIPARRSLLP